MGNVRVLTIAVAFKVYDMDRDGFISNGELFLVLKQMVGTNLKAGLSRSLCLALADDGRTSNYSRWWIRRSWRRTWTGASCLLLAVIVRRGRY